MQKPLVVLAAYFATLAAADSARAGSEPIGVWIDHTGRGAVEITQCGANLCGHLVWVKDGANKTACGTQIIGNAKPVGRETWDGGWIYDPEKKEKYSVELKPIGADKLRVLGYAGSKFFSETMIWKRASADLKKCDDHEPAVTASPSPDAKKAAPLPTADPAPKASTKPARNATKGKTVQQPDKETGCTKYFPQIGETVSVPCER